MQALDEKVIFPLATVRAELMQSSTLRDHLICNYDCANAHSGIGYRAVITRAVAGTQDKRPCAERYERCWQTGRLQRQLGYRPLDSRSTEVDSDAPGAVIATDVDITGPYAWADRATGTAVGALRRRSADNRPLSLAHRC